MNRWSLGLVAGAISLVMVVGCGGGDDSTTVTKAEFTKQAETVCAGAKKEREAALADYAEQVKAATKGISDPALERKLANAMIDESLLPSIQEQLEQIEDLDMPAADQKKIEKMLGSLSSGAEELEGQGVQALVGGQKLIDFQDEAKAYGLNCPF